MRSLKKLRQDYDSYMDRWRASGQPVTPITCRHCSESFDVPQIPDTDSLTTCVMCGELFFKVIDAAGVATGHAYPSPTAPGASP